GNGVDDAIDRVRRHRRTVVRDPRPAPGAGARFLVNVERRPPAADREPDSPEVPHALDHADLPRRPGGDTSRIPDRARRGIAGLDWNAARFRHRVQRGPRTSPEGANAPPPVQDAPRLVRGAGGNPFLSLPDVLPAAAHVGAADHLAGD